MSKPAAQHTPGEWRVTGHERAGTVEGMDDGCPIKIAETYGYGPDEVEANARLIAAAPELLEALQNLENDDNSIPGHAWALVQSAIQKATGGGQ